MPLLPSVAVLLNVFLITSLGPAAYIRFGVWLVLALILYVTYCLKHDTSGAAFVELVPAPEQELVDQVPDRSQGYSSSRSNPLSPRTPKDGLNVSGSTNGGAGGFSCTVDATLDEA
jgi:C-terminus of AA_permease